MADQKIRKKPVQARSRQRVEVILKATRSVIADRGIKGLTTNSIAAQAGIPVSSIYQYFPNKVAILSGLYEDYLQQVVACYDQFDTKDDPTAAWDSRLRMLIEMLYSSEQQDNIELELEVALGLFPELQAIDDWHAEWTAKKLAGYLKRFGSKKSRARLERAASYLYDLNGALWAFRVRYPDRPKEHLEFGVNAALGVVRPFFED